MIIIDVNGFVFPLRPVVFLSLFLFQVGVKVRDDKIGYGFGPHEAVDLALGVFVVGQKELLGGY